VNRFMAGAVIRLASLFPSRRKGEAIQDPKMKLDPQAAQVLEWVHRADVPDYADMSPVEARALFEKSAPTLDAQPEALFRVEDRNIPGPGGDILVRIYTPEESAAPLPAMVWIHGGGFVIGSVDSYDGVCRAMCKQSGAIVVSVNYRLAPEHPHPAAVDDCFAAVQWVAANAASFGGDASRLAVAGDSAGGNLAAVCAILARDHGGPELKRQILVYPATAPDCDSESHHLFGVGHLLTRRMILYFFGMHSGGQDHTQDFRYAPLITPDLSGLAPALVIVAGFDPLRDEGIAYANRLKEAGNPVDLLAFDGMVHGFFSLSGYIDAGKIAIGEVVKSLRAGFGLAA
jgi:acetyl esterase